jgi:homoserine O-acetyltransferase
MMRAARSSLCLLIPSALACATSQQKAQIGDLRLESGEVIRDCTIGYRTMGTLDATKSNAILVTPWFEGTSGQLVRQIGPGKLVDSSKYFVIAVDALGNGVSSSPSNSTLQPGPDFPTFSVRDIVESQYLLVSRTFQLTHLKAVLGISMGGMQVFEWVTAYPDFMDKGISIVGSPRTHPDDQRRWREYVQALQVSRSWKRAARALGRGAVRTAVNELTVDSNDHIRQAQAMMTLDISRPFGGSMERAAAAIRATLLVIGTWQDREVNPEPAFDLARLAHAEVFELDGRCGHQAPSCEAATLWPKLDRFLSQ